ncbi:SGNH/GDSL hydrolase family protein [Paenarthrobacter nicotinovorans]|uniref:SGNH/GDSL hydrolase family protein n=1 Tax=Paenarthrobacter nicotinovorans TaxID=29320 RepID=UPI0024858D91|nr:SGNH/GDSL hydrolase family protein [Paenarthrobacter nicotinovorans]
MLLAVAAFGVFAFAYFKPAPPPAPTIDMAKAEQVQKKFEADQAAQAAAILAANEPLKVAQPAGRPLNVLFAGDSITVGRDASSEATSFRGLLVDRLAKRGPVTPVRIGDSGKLTAEVLPQAASFAGPADLAIVELGTNDIYKSTPEKFAKDYPAMLDAVRKGSPNAPLICVGVWQSSPLAATLDATIDTECAARSGRFVSLRAIHQNPSNKSTPGAPQFAGGLTDGAHPNDEGHSLVAGAILERLNLD